MTRQEALKELTRPNYEEVAMQEDINMVLESINLDRTVFDSLVSKPGKSAKEYKTDRLFAMIQAFMDSRGLYKKKLLE